MSYRGRKHPLSSYTSDEEFSHSAGSVSPEPSVKVWRRDESDDGAGASTSTLTCSLPPSCHDRPQTFSSLELLDAHQQTFHAHKCTAEHYTIELASGKVRGKSQEGHFCDRVFPNERLLTLHQTECHDTVAKLREERGEKIFACFVPACSQMFLTPKKRRLHLIDKHAYPKTYFFGVTLHGVADVLTKGGGMIRRDWKPRTDQVHDRVAQSQSDPESSGTSLHARSVSPESERPGQDSARHGQGQGQGQTVTPSASPARIDEELAEAMGHASIGFVPRSVARKMQGKQGTAMTMG